MAVDSETLRQWSMPEVDHRDEDDVEMVAESIPQRVESKEEEVVVPVVRRTRAKPEQQPHWMK